MSRAWVKLRMRMVRAIQRTMSVKGQPSRSPLTRLPIQGPHARPARLSEGRHRWRPQALWHRKAGTVQIQNPERGLLIQNTSPAWQVHHIFNNLNDDGGSEVCWSHMGEVRRALIGWEVLNRKIAKTASFVM
jgi:hypothetical protein